jgi:adenylate cyclase
MSEGSIAAWLADAGLRNLPLEELVDGFARRLNEAGVGVRRVFVGMDTLHPMVRARSLIWDRATGISAHFEFKHAEMDLAVIRESPFSGMLDAGRFEDLIDLTVPPRPGEPPLFAELRAAGMTSWLARIFPTGELAPRIGYANAVERLGESWLVSSFSTDRPGGFDSRELASLEEFLPLFALATKATTARAIYHGLLAAYLGTDPAKRVFAGTVRRGEVESVEAVLLYADLRSFTALADVTPGRDLIHLLDECFDCMARPVTRQGGEILKFMGDGLLAIFRIDGRRRADICAGALAAASAALDLMVELATRRQASGLLTPELNVALHIGTVQYGNVGAEQRLDFTVIGPAVNEASRIQALCKELGPSLLVSEAFANAATTSRSHLTSLGRHTLRGVREPAEIFTLTPGPPS